MEILCIIPARGGSKGIPRKNLRTLNGEPLLAYAIKTAQTSSYNLKVFVSTEDEEIACIARKYGAGVIERPPELAGDDVTIDPVVDHAVSMYGDPVAAVVTVQPTSPLLNAESLDCAIDAFLTGDWDTTIAAGAVNHLLWQFGPRKWEPLHAARVNRQSARPVYAETGAFTISRPGKPRIGERVELYPLSGREAVDIDDPGGFALAEHYIKTKRILFVVAGNRETGLGHISRALTLAGDMVEHETTFLVPAGHGLAASRIRAANYSVREQRSETLAEDIWSARPDLVIHDCLDTTAEHMERLDFLGIPCVNFEDMGKGATYAKAVINELYPFDDKWVDRAYMHDRAQGPSYAVLRDEFLLSDPIRFRPEVRNVLVVFGGTDPAGLTEKVADAIVEGCNRNAVNIIFVTGAGTPHSKKYWEYGEQHSTVKNISEHMQRADVAISSAGRTLYELSALGVPAIVMAQNDRELSHIAPRNLHLGLGSKVRPEEIWAALETVIKDPDLRRRMHEDQLALDVRSGRRRVVDIIRGVLNAS